ncbi:MAG: hypothetical protein HXY43_21395 [Fischerella sp.]|uniref:hypothetical protein n=1 Tax=Fischerella sp. TaxID=1191 RepID=UPI0017A7A9FA|nr:hypothetical protein [Fischerella sp.]NWF61738.1 hypothetical protein [Fischerella sp.]
MLEIQSGYAAKAILRGIKNREIDWCDGTLEEFIEAAHALDLEYDYQKNRDGGYDFMAWNSENDEKVARIKL